MRANYHGARFENGMSRGMTIQCMLQLVNLKRNGTVRRKEVYPWTRSDSGTRITQWSYKGPLRRRAVMRNNPFASEETSKVALIPVPITVEFAKKRSRRGLWKPCYMKTGKSVTMGMQFLTGVPVTLVTACGTMRCWNTEASREKCPMSAILCTRVIEASVRKGMSMCTSTPLGIHLITETVAMDIRPTAVSLFTTSAGMARELMTF